MTEHTPGPWTPEDSDYGWDIRGSDGYLIITYSDIGTGLSEADARLIAAAPDLLTALKNLARVCESVCRGWPAGDPIGDIKVARALVAKAEGRNP